MTLEMQTALERELKDAKTPEDRALAQSHILLALMDCQRKTAERVKKLSWKVISIALALGTGGMNPDGSPRTDGLYRNRGTGSFVIGPNKA